MVYCNLGTAYGFLCQYDKAISFFEKLLAIALELEDRAGQGVAYSNLGISYRCLGQYNKAIVC